MPTYTDCHIRVRENLTIQRMPGNPCDGITQQRAIFANPENQYYGTFIGDISAGQVSLSNAVIQDTQIAGGSIACSALDMQGGQISNAVIVQPNITIDVNGSPVGLSEFLALLSSELSSLNARCECNADDGSSDEGGSDDGDHGGSCPIDGNDGVC